MSLFNTETSHVSSQARIIHAGRGAAKIVLTLDIQEGWFVRVAAEEGHLGVFQLDIRGEDVARIIHIEYPSACPIDLPGDTEELYWQGSVTFNIEVALKTSFPEHPMRAVLSYQPCTIGCCMAIQYTVIDVGNGLSS